jgi:hypothetical protein
MRGICFIALLSLSLAGCATEQQVQNKYVEKPQAVYDGLKGNPAAVMVWADWRTRTEYNQVEIDTARRLTEKLSRPRKEGKKQETTAGQFVNPASVVRYQREHPEVMSMPITEVAPKLGAQRVIYIEIAELVAHSPESIMVLKGHAKATLRVLEVEGNKATVVFEESGITANFPPESPEGVIPSDKWNVRTIYDGTLDLLTEKLAVRFKT